VVRVAGAGLRGLVGRGERGLEGWCAGVGAEAGGVGGRLDIYTLVLVIAAEERR